VNGFECYRTYVALKAHFAGTFDFFKYGINTKATKTSLNNRNDKYFFEKLARRSDCFDYLLANLATNPNFWIGDLEEGEKVCQGWMRRTQSMVYHLSNEVETLPPHLNTILRVDSGQHPQLLHSVLNKHISLETFCIMNEMLSFSRYWDRAIKDTIIWPELSIRVVRYQPFLKYDRDKARKVLVGYFSEGDK
jgi:hypothetical protein